MKKLILFFALSLVVGSCGSKNADDSDASTPSSQSQMADSATDSLNGVLSNTGLVAQIRVQKPKSEMVAKFLQDLVLPEAQATACSAIGGYTTSACSSGMKTRTFDCTIGSATLTGTTTFNYDTMVCTAAGDFQVTRETDLTLTGPFGGTLTVSSANHNNYNGNSVGGGQRYTSASGTNTYRVPGMHRVLTSSGGTTIFDISTQTTSDFTVTGSTLADLTVTGGTLNIYHNLARYMASWTASNVHWSLNCYCPTGGTMTGTFSDSITGTMTITYGSTCGEASVVGIDGSTSTVNLTTCSTL